MIKLAPLSSGKQAPPPLATWSNALERLVVASSISAIVVLIRVGTQGSWTDFCLLALGCLTLMGASGIMPFKLLVLNLVLLTLVAEQFCSLPLMLLAISSGVVGVSTMICFLYLLLDLESGSQHQSSHTTKGCEEPHVILASLPPGPPKPSSTSTSTGGDSSSKRSSRYTSRQHHKRGMSKSSCRRSVTHSTSLQSFQALALDTMVTKGFGANLPPTDLRYTAVTIKKYGLSEQVAVQVSMVVHAIITLSMLPDAALRSLARLLRRRCASFQVRQSAVREGCIVVTLDVLQLANILSSMEMQQQQQQEQAEGEGSKPDQSRRITAANEERFRLLQRQVAAASQEWLCAMGMDSTLQEGTVMSVQVLDCVHRFKWDASTNIWNPCSSELVPFACQHSIATHTSVALLPPAGNTAEQPQQQDASPPAQIGFLKGVSVAEITLEVETQPGEILMGWSGAEQEEEEGPSSPGGSSGVVYVLARSEGGHLPVKIVDCLEAQVTRVEAGYAKQKQVLRVQVACEDRPCLVQLELWQHHVILAPACGVLILPQSMAKVAEELNAHAATVTECNKRAEGSLSWDCAAAETEGDGSHRSSKRTSSEWGRENGLVAFMEDLGFWLEAQYNTDKLGTQAAPSDKPEGAFAVSPSSPRPISERASEVSNTKHIGCDLLQQAMCWGLPDLAEHLLLGLMQGPSNIPFARLANGSNPEPAPAHDQNRSPDDSRELDIQADGINSLLNLALLSRSSKMMARLLAWGHTYGGPDFTWSWRAEGAHGITPLLRIQALSSTHRELVEMVLADLHAGPSLLASWLQEGPQGLLLETERPSYHSPIVTLSPASSTSVPNNTPVSSSPDAATPPNGSKTVTTTVSTAAAHPPHPSQSQQAHTPLGTLFISTAKESTLQFLHNLSYTAWLLRCCVWGFPKEESRLPECVLQAYSVPTASASASRQQGSNSASRQLGGVRVSESQYQAWMQIAHTRAFAVRASKVSAIIQPLWICLSLWITFGTQKELLWYISHVWHILPFYGGFVAMSMITGMLAERLGCGVSLGAFKVWTAFASYWRGLWYFLASTGRLAHSPAICDPTLYFYGDFVMEGSWALIEMMPFSAILTGRIVVAYAYYSYYTVHPIVKACPILRASAVHGFSVLVYIAQSFRLRHKWVAHLSMRLKQE